MAGQSAFRSIIRVNRLLAELGHTDVIAALEELRDLRAGKASSGRGRLTEGLLGYGPPVRPSAQAGETS